MRKGLEGAEAVKQFSQRSCASPTPGCVQDQVVRDSEQPCLVEGVSVHSGVGWNWVMFKVISNSKHSMIP